VASKFLTQNRQRHEVKFPWTSNFMNFFVEKNGEHLEITDMMDHESTYVKYQVRTYKV
jgi:hypothetical protein